MHLLITELKLFRILFQKVDDVAPEVFKADLAAEYLFVDNLKLFLILFLTLLSLFICILLTELA